MKAAALTNWSARPSCRAYLFRNLLGACVVLLVAYSFWPWLAGNQIAQVLAACIVVLAHCYFLASWKQAAREQGAHTTLSRIAAGHWRMTANGRVSDGFLDHVWYGWGWVSLRIQPYAGGNAVVLTVWRSRVSPEAWHCLRVWSAWESAMSGHSVRVGVSQ